MGGSAFEFDDEREERESTCIRVRVRSTTRIQMVAAGRVLGATEIQYKTITSKKHLLFANRSHRHAKGGWRQQKQQGSRQAGRGCKQRPRTTSEQKQKRHKKNETKTLHNH